jgi:hypothetical protein
VVNESRVEAGLRKNEVVRAQAALLLGDEPVNGFGGGLEVEGKGGRNRHVVVSEERVCGVCHKRLGRSVVAVMPGSEVVHYGCLGRAGQRRTESGAWGDVTAVSRGSRA